MIYWILIYLDFGNCFGGEFIGEFKGFIVVVYLFGVVFLFFFIGVINEKFGWRWFIFGGFVIMVVGFII